MLIQWVWIATFCFVMTLVSATTAMHGYRPPWLDALLWFGVGVWIVVVGLGVSKRIS